MPSLGHRLPCWENDLGRINLASPEPEQSRPLSSLRAQGLQQPEGSLGVSFLHVLAFKGLQTTELRGLSPLRVTEEVGSARTAGSWHLWEAGGRLGERSWSV